MTKLIELDLELNPCSRKFNYKYDFDFNNGPTLHIYQKAAIYKYTRMRISVQNKWSGTDGKAMSTI